MSGPQPQEGALPSSGIGYPVVGAGVVRVGTGHPRQRCVCGPFYVNCREGGNGSAGGGTEAVSGYYSPPYERHSKGLELISVPLRAGPDLVFLRVIGRVRSPRSKSVLSASSCVSNQAIWGLPVIEDTDSRLTVIHAADIREL